MKKFDRKCETFITKLNNSANNLTNYNKINKYFGLKETINSNYTISRFYHFREMGVHRGM